jgi:hypothetical protein
VDDDAAAGGEGPGDIREDRPLAHRARQP